MSSGTLRVDTKRKLAHVFHRAFEQTMASLQRLSRKCYMQVVIKRSFFSKLSISFGRAIHTYRSRHVSRPATLSNGCFLSVVFL